VSLNALNILQVKLNIVVTFFVQKIKNSTIKIIKTIEKIRQNVIKTY